MNTKDIKTPSDNMVLGVVRLDRHDLLEAVKYYNKPFALPYPAVVLYKMHGCYNYVCTATNTTGSYSSMEQLVKNAQVHLAALKARRWVYNGSSDLVYFYSPIGYLSIAANGTFQNNWFFDQHTDRFVDFCENNERGYTRAYNFMSEFGTVMVFRRKPIIAAQTLGGMSLLDHPVARIKMKIEDNLLRVVGDGCSFSATDMDGWRWWIKEHATALFTSGFSPRAVFEWDDIKHPTDLQLRVLLKAKNALAVGQVKLPLIQGIVDDLFVNPDIPSTLERAVHRVDLTTLF